MAWPHSSYKKQGMNFIIMNPIPYYSKVGGANALYKIGELQSNDRITGDYRLDYDDNWKNADLIKITSSSKTPGSVGFYIQSSDAQSVILYNDWSKDEINATIISSEGAKLIVDEYIEYYDAVNYNGNYYDFKFAGTLVPGDTVWVKYSSDKRAMFILKAVRYDSDNNPIILEATNKYLISAYKTYIGNSTQEAIPGATSNNQSNYNTSGLQYYNSNATTNGSISVSPDEALLEIYGGNDYASQEEYNTNLAQGLRVHDLRGIIGLPHQFLPITDPRIESNDSYGDEYDFGRVYSEKIIKHIPLLLMTPGLPSFMQNYTKEQKEGIFNKLISGLTEIGSSLFNILGSDVEKNGKYYSLRFAYTDYFDYVNAMLRSAAFYLELQNEEIDGNKLGSLNWLYKTCNIGEKNIFSTGNLDRYLGPNAGCIAFYADVGTSIDDSFSNSTTDSQLSQTVNSLSETAREVNFLVGNIGGMAGVNTDLLGGATGSLNVTTDNINKILGGNNILSNVLGQATTVIGGGKLIFPKIWSDSSFSRSYSCSMKLVSPAGDKLSIFLNILVPIYHLLGFCLPRQSANQAYFSPFLVRAYYKGLFNIDMGVISSLSITKGEEGEWSIDGIPTVANINFEIEDLYSGMYMSPFSFFDNDYSIMTNIQELDYIANSCGINVNDQEISRTLKMYAALGFAELNDSITIDIFAGISQNLNQKLQNIFGKY